MIVQSNGINMFYEQYGQGPPLVLLMGLGAPGSRWEEHVEQYARHFSCIVIDNRGVGRSDQPPGPYTTATMADDAAGLITALGVPSAHVSGISMGGAIAQELALRHPNLVRSLILNCTWPRGDVYTLRIFSLLRALAFTNLPMEEFVRFIFLLIFSPVYHATNQEDLARRQEDILAYPYPQSPDAFAAQCDACMTHDTLDRLDEIRAPTLITVGRQDIFTPLAYAQAIHERIGQSELAIFDGAGHAHHWEQREHYNFLTLAFLKGLK